MIEFKKVNQTFGDYKALININLKLTENRIGIIGNNGSGKSTFARLINGLLYPSEGSVLVDDLNTATSSPEIRKKVGFIFQNPEHQLILPTVAEDLGFGLKILKFSKNAINEKVENILEEYGLAALKNKSVQNLSGGQKQLIALLGVLIMNPKYIIMDEPTTLLDLRNKQLIHKVIQKLPQKICVISHDLDFLKDFDRILVFKDGHIIEDAKPSIAFKRYYDSLK